jgi:hypothetical protein
VVNPLLQGVHGAIQNGATVATAKIDIKCQTKVLGATGKLLLTKLKLVQKCIRTEFMGGATSPPVNCIDNLHNDPSTAAKVNSAIGKLTAAALGRCPAAPPPPFDGGQCAGLEGMALADCIDVIVECRVCRWANGLLGGSFDCDDFDNGLVDGSCLP